MHSIRVSTGKTAKDGSFSFNNIPAGKYKLVIEGVPQKSVTVGHDGNIGGKVIKGSDGKLSISNQKRQTLNSLPSQPLVRQQPAPPPANPKFHHALRYLR